MGYLVPNPLPPPSVSGLPLTITNFPRLLTTSPHRSSPPYTPVARAQPCQIPETLSPVLGPPPPVQATLYNRYNRFLTLYLHHLEPLRSAPMGVMLTLMSGSLWLLYTLHLNPPYLRICYSLLLCHERKQSRHQLC